MQFPARVPPEGADIQQRTMWKPPSREARAPVASFVPLLVAATLLVLLAAPSTPGTKAAEGLATPTTMTFGMMREPDSINPFTAILPTSWYVLDIVYDLLVGFGPNFEPVPQLARSWSVWNSNLTWTFNLFRNATWHDGTPVTAHDVEWTYEFIINNSAGASHDELTGIYPGTGYTPAYADAIRAIDDFTLEITTIVPKANMLGLWIPILQKAEWSVLVPGYANSTYPNIPPTGSGPWILDTWVAGQYIQFHANTNYHLGTPKFDLFVMKSYVSSSALIEDLKTGMIDATNFIYTSDWAGLQGLPYLRTSAVEEIGIVELGLNSAPEWALRPSDGANFNRELRNMSVRKALAQVIDKQFLVDNARLGLGPPGSSLIPTATAFWHNTVPDSELYKFNLAAASAALDPWYQDVDFDGIRENLTNPSKELSFTLHIPYSFVEEQAAMAYYVEWARQVGIRITPLLTSEMSLLQLTLQANFDLFVWAWMAEADPDFLLSVMTTDQIPSLGGFRQDVWYSNPEYDALYELQATQTNRTERQATVFRMQQILYRDTPYIVLWYYTGLYGVRTDRFSNWPDFSQNPNLAIFGMGNGFMFLQVTPGGAPVNAPPHDVDVGGPYLDVPSNASRTYAARAQDADDTRLDFSWDFGDGTAPTTSTVLSTNGSFTAQATHTYSRPGTYALRLTVTDESLNVATGSTSVLVVSDTTNPVAVASASPNPADEGTPVTLSGAGSTDNGAVVNWTWIFVEKTVSHTLYGEIVGWTFTEPGVWNVTLSVRDAAGNSDTEVVQVTVLDRTPPTAVASLDATALEGTTIQLVGTGSADNVGVVSYTWNVTLDGELLATLTGATVSYEFTDPGSYTVTLTVRDLAGNMATDSMIVTVEARGFVEQYWWALLVASIAVVGIGLAFWLRRSR